MFTGSPSRSQARGPPPRPPTCAPTSALCVASQHFAVFNCTTAPLAAKTPLWKFLREQIRKARGSCIRAAVALTTCPPSPRGSQASSQLTAPLRPSQWALHQPPFRPSAVPGVCVAAHPKRKGSRASSLAPGSGRETGCEAAHPRRRRTVRVRDRPLLRHNGTQEGKFLLTPLG